MFIPLRREKPVFDAARQDPVDAARRINRRRLVVFVIVFLAVLLPGLAWNLLRAPEYRATARVMIAAGSIDAQMVTTPTTSSAELSPAQRIDLLTQTQLLTSHAILDDVRRRLAGEGLLGQLAAADPIAALQQAVAATPIDGTNIVELHAVGASPQLTAKIVNTLIEAYHERSLASHDVASQEAVAKLREEVERLAASIGEKRAQLAAFREKSGVISSERTENEVLARIKGLSDSLNKATEDAVKAEARLRALREADGAGRTSALAKDNPTQAAIEQRISATREQLRDMERTYTPEFMAMDPNAKALRARLAELEAQLASSRSSSRQAALNAAEEEAAGARATVDRLRAQIAAQRREAQAFSGNFLEAKAIEEDVVRLEGARRNAGERLAKLEATERTRLPSLTLVEAARPPEKSWRPDYGRDALINLAAAFVLGLLAIWFVELFNRSPAAEPAAPTAILMGQPWLSPALGMPAPAAPLGLVGQAERPALPEPAPALVLPRELSQDEVGDLLAAADDEGRLLCALLLLGLRVDEIRGLSGRQIDPARASLQLGGEASRALKLPGWLVELLEKAGPGDPERPVLRNAAGQPLADAEIASRVTCAAIDAGLEAPAQVTPASLRHTYILHLLGQNVRFSHLQPLVGPLDAEELAAYASLASGPRQVNGADVEPLMPALRQPPA